MLQISEIVKKTEEMFDLFIDSPGDHRIPGRRAWGLRLV